MQARESSKEKTHLESTIRKRQALNSQNWTLNQGPPTETKATSNAQSLDTTAKYQSLQPLNGFKSIQNESIQKTSTSSMTTTITLVRASASSPLQGYPSNRQDFSLSSSSRPRSQISPTLAQKSTAHEVRSSARYIRIAATRLARPMTIFSHLLNLKCLMPGENRALKAKVFSLDSIEAPNRWRKSNSTDGIWAKEGDPEASAKMAQLNLQKTRFLEKYRTPKRKARLGDPKSIKDLKISLEFTDR